MEKHKLLHTGTAVLTGRSEKPRQSGISENTDGVGIMGTSSEANVRISSATTK